MKLLVCIFLLTSSLFSAYGQLPATNILLLNVESVDENGGVENIKFLTDFNRDGYNNQPHFVDENKLMISSSFDAKGLTDIYLMDLKLSKLQRITATEESEYSPLLWEDGKITVVRQELSNQKQVPQLLWQYPLARDTKGRKLFSKYQNIGYYCWLPDDELALFLVGEPSKLVIVNTKTEKETFVTYNVGRAIKYDDNGGLIYVLKMGNSWSIKRYALDEDMSQYLTTTLTGTEDFEIMPGGKIISGKGSVLYTFDPVKKDGWKKYVDLSKYKVQNISRIASFKDQLALVVTY